jgi:hypothetical protein
LCLFVVLEGVEKSVGSKATRVMYAHAK